MQGYFNLILGQLDHWRTNARNLYGARGFLAPSRTDGEYGHMLHFDARLPRPLLDRRRRLAALPAAGVLPGHRRPGVPARQARPGADGAGPVLRGLPDPHRLGRQGGVRAVLLDGELPGSTGVLPGDQRHRRHQAGKTRPAGRHRRRQRARRRTGRRPGRRTLDGPAGEDPRLPDQRRRRARRMVLAGPDGPLQPSARPSPVRRVATARDQSRGGARLVTAGAPGPGAAR